MGVLRNLILALVTLLGIALLFVTVTWKWLSYELIPNRVYDIGQIQNMSFDYIVVGAGTAGCVLANRLSADANHSVLLIEAGDVFGAASIVPLFSTAMQQTEVDWAFRTTPQKHSSHGLINNQQFLPRGRGLGGSGQINYMLHFTGIEQDFDRWQQLGAPDWGYAQLKPYLEKHEQEHQPKSVPPEGVDLLDVGCGTAGSRKDDEIFEQNQYPTFIQSDKSPQLEFCSKTSPPTTVEPKLHVTPVRTDENLLAKAFTDVGLELSSEYRFEAAKYTIRKGVRWSSYHAYLRQAFGRPNLYILTNTVSQKILFDDRKRATGVRISDEDENPVELKANKEIILSAGAIQTPQLLKLSGVGPALELRRHRIPLVHDSPNVGQNYFDHLNLPLFVSINTSASVTLTKVLDIRSLKSYLRDGKGVLSTTAVAGIGSNARSGGHSGIILFGMGSVDEQALRHVSNMDESTFRAFFPLHHNTSQEGFLMLNTCHHPKSRGAVYLRDLKANSSPFINPNYLKDRFDIDCMIKAIRTAAKTVNSVAFQKLGAKLHWPMLKRCANFGPYEEDFKTNRPSERYLECILRISALTGHHPGGTAAIGANSDAPIDNELRVNGVCGLRVVDGSVFPAPVSGTPNSVIVAVAERAADVILRDKV
ncbi:neither inactivation nor afterpotential protein G-like [Uranotaenia lowii]|uniref:neither inactivation nor afterpotential protein G-like n=1 Tax=Uranotaenia lowii TaxID=190385 RepID=UPI00247874FB|nr:neither inactivation nor afterpotential protein G-like [Uranotaenia lowii]